MTKIKLFNKGKYKNLLKRDYIYNMKKDKVSNKKGSALAETIILIAVSLVLAIVLFYPQFSNLLSNVMNRMNNWVNSTLSII